MGREIVIDNLDDMCDLMCNNYVRSDQMEKNYSVKQAAILLGVKVRTVREWIVKGNIKAYKYDFSSRWFIPESELKRVMSGKSDT